MGNEIYVMLELQAIWNKVLDSKTEITRSRHGIDLWRDEMKSIGARMSDLRSRVNQLKLKIKEKEMELIEELIYDALTHRDNSSILSAIASKVKELNAKFPIYDGLSYV